ncbi:Hypothetical protein PHPALM_13641 [Phytophthora palmivora]|uniref:Uncharacterized protein n=1 Tax=Phytophthora palmivora TaxID=4796 RepID=A0A2P4XWR1_9STRA|nr:Hypothetical protein PHPALM_13641 [Phytophthora palmivora]
MEEFYNLIRQWYNPTKHTNMLPQTAEKISPDLKPVPDERSSYRIYAYVEKQSEATVNQLIDSIDNTCDLLENSVKSTPDR